MRLDWNPICSWIWWNDIISYLNSQRLQIWIQESRVANPLIGPMYINFFLKLLQIKPTMDTMTLYIVRNWLLQLLASLLKSKLNWFALAVNTCMAQYLINHLIHLLHSHQTPDKIVRISSVFNYWKKTKIHNLGKEIFFNCFINSLGRYYFLWN